MEVECEIAEYVYDAFDVGAFQSLLKPIDEQRFAGVFGRAAGREKRKSLHSIPQRHKNHVPLPGIIWR